MSLWTNILERADLRSRERRADVAHREAMRALKDALTAAESAQKTRDEFLARMSHELRTPLNAVIGLSRVLEKNSGGNLRPEDIHLLGRVRAGGEQLLHLVENVLDQSQLEGGEVLPVVSDTDVVGIAASV